MDAALQTEVLRLHAEDRDPTALPIRSVLVNSLLKGWKTRIIFNKGIKEMNTE